MLLLQTYRDSAPFPTAKRISNPAGCWAQILGRESQSLDLSKVFILIMFPFILFCPLLFHFQSHIWPGQLIAFSHHWVLLLFELFFTVGLARLRGGNGIILVSPLFELTLCPRTSYRPGGKTCHISHSGNYLEPFCRGKAAIGPHVMVPPLKTSPLNFLDDVCECTQIE